MGSLACYQEGLERLAAGDVAGALLAWAAAAPRIAAAELALLDHQPAADLARRMRERLQGPELHYERGLRALPAAWADVALVPLPRRDAGHPGERAAARAHLLAAADGGHARAMFWLARIDGCDPVGAPPDAAEIWLRQAAEAGEPAAMEDLAALLLGMPPGTAMHQEGLAWAARAADAGSERQRLAMAARACEGVAVPLDLERARAWLQAAAEAGSAQAEERWRTWFGKATRAPRLAEGLVVRARRAAEQGSPGACLELGLLLAERQPAVALPWLRRAAREDLPGALEPLAALLDGGPPDLREPAEALLAWIRAAKAGSAEARRQLVQRHGSLARAFAAVLQALRPQHRDLIFEVYRLAEGPPDLPPLELAGMLFALAGWQRTYLPYAVHGQRPEELLRLAAALVITAGDEQLACRLPCRLTAATSAGLAYAHGRLAVAAEAGDLRSAYELGRGWHADPLVPRDNEHLRRAAAGGYLPALCLLALAQPDPLPLLWRAAALAAAGPLDLDAAGGDAPALPELEALPPPAAVALSLPALLPPREAPALGGPDRPADPVEAEPEPVEPPDEHWRTPWEERPGPVELPSDPAPVDQPPGPLGDTPMARGFYPDPEASPGPWWERLAAEGPAALEPAAADGQPAACYVLGRHLAEHGERERGLALVARAAPACLDAALYREGMPAGQPAGWREQGALERLRRGGDRLQLGLRAFQAALRLAAQPEQQRVLLGQARGQLEPLALAGDAAAAWWLAWVLQQRGPAGAWLEAAARLGSEPAMSTLAELAGTAGQRLELLRRRRQAAEAGSPAAAHALGLLFYEGRETRFDLAMAFHWLSRAADTGHASAAALLARAFDADEPLPWGPFTGLLQHERAAAAGNASAMAWLGRHHEPHDLRAALAWYERAARAGHRAAAERLVGLYRIGPREVQDPVKALRWCMLLIARDRADAERRGWRWVDDYATRYADLHLRFGSLADSRLALARRFALGLGLPRDPAAALRWYGLARSLMPPGSLAELRVALEEALLARRYPELGQAPVDAARQLARAAVMRPAQPWLQAARSLQASAPWLQEDEGFYFLLTFPAPFVAGLLAAERPAVAAGVLAELGEIDPELQAEVLAELPAHRRPDDLEGRLPPLLRRWVQRQLRRACSDEVARVVSCP